MLLLQTDRDSLLKPLQAVTGIVERKHTLPILSNVLLEGKNGRVHILATDAEIQIHTVGAETGVGDFKITTNAKKLQDILRALPDSAIVQLEKSEKLENQADNKLNLKAGKSRFQLQTLPAEEFPTMRVNDEAKVRFSLSQEVFKNMIAQVQYSMAVQDVRYYLVGLLLQVEGKHIRLVATDANRLSYVQANLELDATITELPKTEIILPRKTVLELNKLLNKPNEDVLIELLDNQIRFRLNGDETVIVSKVIDGKFPDYNRAIPLDNNKIFVLNRQELLGALERSAILANEKFRSVRFQLSAGVLRVVCSNNEQEEAQEELEIAYQGESLEIGFNISYLVEMLRSIHSDDVQLALSDASRSTLLTIPNNPDFKYVVMPMRI